MVFHSDGYEFHSTADCDGCSDEPKEDSVCEGGGARSGEELRRQEVREMFWNVGEMEWRDGMWRWRARALDAAALAGALHVVPVVRLNAHTRVHREAAVLVAQHLFGISLLDQTPAHEGAQDASAQVSLRLSPCNLIDSTGRVEYHTGCRGLSISIARHHLKHPVDHTDVEVHTPRPLQE